MLAAARRQNAAQRWSRVSARVASTLPPRFGVLLRLPGNPLQLLPLPFPFAPWTSHDTSTATSTSGIASGLPPSADTAAATARTGDLRRVQPPPPPVITGRAG